MSRSSSKAIADPAQLELPVDAPLAERLYQAGLPRGTPVTPTRNRSVLLSYRPRRGLRLHAGFSAAPADVLHAIVRFVAPRATRAERRTARRAFMAFPVEHHATSRGRRARRRDVMSDADLAIVERLRRAHRDLNACWFGGALQPIGIHLSHRMRTRLGEWRGRLGDLPEEIVISARHITRQGWTAALDTLLHEMIHQWQAETGRTVGHDREFRRMARAVGVSPRAVADVGPSRGR